MAKKAKKKRIPSDCSKCHFKATGECKKNSPCELYLTSAEFTTFVKNLLRKGTFLWKSRKLAKDLAKVGPATTQCQCCGAWVYEGARKLEKAREITNPPESVEFFKGKIKMDHVKPVVDPKIGFSSWDDFIYGMYCFFTNFSPICEKCHKMKTAAERKERENG